MKIYKRGSFSGYGYMIQAPASLIRTVVHDPRYFDQYPCNPSEQCTFTFSKLYYKGGGWWWLNGYDANHQDVERVVARLREQTRFLTLSERE